MKFILKAVRLMKKLQYLFYV